MALKEKKGKIVLASIRMVSILIIAIAAIFVTYRLTKKDEPEITNTFISEKLEAVSELTTAKLTYTGLVRYTEGNIPFLTKKEFNMLYRAGVRAGIDLSQANIDVTDSEVKLTLPKAEIQEISVDADSIQFYDESFALFNGEKREDTVEALKVAEEDVRENGNMEDLMAEAQEQTEILLTGFLDELIGDRTLVISYR